MSRRRGTTLVETVVALFIITGCLLIIVKMIFVGVDVQRRASFNERAALLAERHLGRVRTWAADPDHFYTPGAWSAVAAGVPVPDVDAPEFSVRIQAQPEIVFSPCDQAENRYLGPPDERRAMTQSFYRVQVDVAWQPTSPKNVLTLVTLVGAPETPVEQASVSLDNAGPLPRDAVTNVTVAAEDVDGRVIPDQFWLWSQGPAGSAGSIGSFPVLSRTGASVQYRHRYRTVRIGGSDQPVYGPAGSVLLRAAGRSPSLLDTASGRWCTNASAQGTVENQ